MTGNACLQANFEGLESTDSLYLQGMQNRSMSADAGAEVVYRARPVGFRVNALSDILGRNRQTDLNELSASDCWRADSFARAVNEKHATAAPDLVVEVLSPGTRRRDLGLKRDVYDREGVQEYWLVDPAAVSITVLRRPEPGAGLTQVSVLALTSGDVLESPLFPRLKIRLRDVFRPAGA